MNLKIMPKIAIGTLLLSSALVTTACKNSGNKDFDRYSLHEDVAEFSNRKTNDNFEVSDIEEEENFVTKDVDPRDLPEITTERNMKCEERCGWLDNSSEILDYLTFKDVVKDELYEKRGTYGASMAMQKLNDFYKFMVKTSEYVLDYLGMQAAEELGVPYDEFYPIDYSEYPETEKYFSYYYGEYDDINDLKQTPSTILQSDEELFEDGPVSADKCLKYLDKQLDVLKDNSALSTKQYKELLNEVEDYKKNKQPLTVEGLAEVVAFKQHKVDSITTAKYLQANGWWNPQTRYSLGCGCKQNRNSFFE